MSLKNYSTTAGSNTSAPPDGAPEGWALSDINNTMRQVMADIRTLAASDTIASAATCDLGTKDSTFLTVSGTTTITSFGTVSAGIHKYVTFSGALTLTRTATSLILLGAVNRTTVAGDVGMYLSLGSGNWRECFYSPIGAYQPLDAQLTTLSGMSAAQATDLAAGFVTAQPALMGYGTGAGGSVTQLTSKSTGVTLNKPAGTIVTHNASLAAGVKVFFTVSNSLVSANDLVVLNIADAAASISNYQIWVQPVSGGFVVFIENLSAGALSEVITLKYAIIKGVTT